MTYRANVFNVYMFEISLLFDYVVTVHITGK